MSDVDPVYFSWKGYQNYLGLFAWLFESVMLDYNKEIISVRILFSLLFQDTV